MIATADFEVDCEVEKQLGQVSLDKALFRGHSACCHITETDRMCSLAIKNSAVIFTCVSLT